MFVTNGRCPRDRGAAPEASAAGARHIQYILAHLHIVSVSPHWNAGFMRQEFGLVHALQPEQCGVHSMGSVHLW